MLNLRVNRTLWWWNCIYLCSYRGWRQQLQSAPHPFSTYTDNTIFGSGPVVSTFSHCQNMVPWRHGSVPFPSLHWLPIQIYFALIPPMSSCSIRGAREPFPWAFCDGLWIIHLNMIDRWIELRDRLLIGLIKRIPDSHWNLSVTETIEGWSSLNRPRRSTSLVLVHNIRQC